MFLSNLKTRWLTFVLSKSLSESDEVHFARYYLRLRREVHAKRLEVLRIQACKEWGRAGWRRTSAIACDELCDWLRTHHSPELAAQRDVEIFYRGAIPPRIQAMIDEFFAETVSVLGVDESQPVAV